MRRPNPEIKARYPDLGQKSRGRRKWLLLPLLAAAVLGAYFLFYDHLPGTDPRPERPPGAAPADGRPERGTIIRPSIVARGGPTRSADGARGRSIIAQLRNTQGAPDLAQAYARAEAFREAGMTTDAYLLYFFAAREGHVQSALMLGTMADPEYFSTTPSLLDGPDPSQAYKWYRQAVEQGNEVARGRLERLREQVENAAASGDGKAQRLLLRWKQ